MYNPPEQQGRYRIAYLVEQREFISAAGIQEAERIAARLVRTLANNNRIYAIKVLSIEPVVQPPPEEDCG